MEADRDSILKLIGSREPEPFDVEEWDTTLYLKHLTVGEWIDCEVDGDDTQTGFNLLASAMTNKDGKPIFSVDDLMAMPGDQQKVLMKVFAKIKQMRVVHGKKK